MSCGLYEIQIGSYFYHGSSKNIHKRMVCHKSKLKLNKHPNPKMQAIFNKYNEFKYEVILTCKESDLEYLEQLIIDAHIGDKSCMNLATTVGNAMRGRKHTEETKEKMSAAMKGNQNTLGYIHSAETRAKISAAMTNNFPSEETRQKLSTAGKRRKQSEETRKRISEANKGNQNALGHKRSEETRAKMSEARANYLQKQRENK